MKKRTIRILALALVLVMTMGLAACGGSSKGSGDEYAITYWLSRAEDSSLYAEYEENPVINYITQNHEFNGKHIAFDFVTAPPGGEADDFNNLMGTGSYCDIMSMSMSGSSPAQLYSEGMVWDLTELVPEHMPNLMAFLEANPDLADDFYSYVDGETKILSLTGFADIPDPNFEGFCYRRDWIVKYGKNPMNGQSFSGGFAVAGDINSWTDDVVFPSGGSDPIYISDWEWMFEIFTTALEDLGITDGYCYSLFYQGYMQTGDLYTGFGGGAPFWYADGDTIVNGVTTDNMRAFVQCMNTWYNNGWMDAAFDEHTNDMFFAVDSSKVFQGKVGLWQGRMSTIGTQIDSGSDYTEGAMVFGCRQPINDIYGGAEQQGKIPNAMYQYSRKNGDYVVLTDKMDEDAVIAFLEFADFLYTDEGKLLGNVGMNQEQYEKTPSAFYEKNGLTEGAYTVEVVDGKNVYHPKVNPTTTVFNAVCLSRIGVRLTMNDGLDRGYDNVTAQAVANWDYYPNTAKIPSRVTASMTPEQNQQVSKIRASLDPFQQRVVPAMIKGEGYDVWNDADWESFCKDINKYRASEITAIYQTVLDSCG